MDEETSFFQKPLFKRLVKFGLFVMAYVLIGPVYGFFSGDTGDHSLEMLFDALLCIVGMVGWMVFFSQFVLPVSKLRDRWRVFKRLVIYIRGGHGPAIFVENGFARSKEGENKKSGPGVIWLDSASAAVLRSTSRFTRTIGPGVHFTNHHETIAATADLHTLTQAIGPIESDNPFVPLENHPDYKALTERTDLNSEKRREALGVLENDYKASKERADLTSAMTRDGIKVSASISVNFRIRSIAGEGSTPFGFNAANTEAAIRDSMVRESNLDQPVWNSLPARMAVDIWREYLGKYRLNELFEKSGAGTDTTLQFINDMIKKRLTKAQVDVLDEAGRVVLENKNREAEYLHNLQENKRDVADKLLKKNDSREFLKLSEMGLEVTGVVIKKLLFTPDVEDQLVNQWTTRWLQNAQKDREQVERERNSAEQFGQNEGVKDFAAAVSRNISKEPTTSPADALIKLVLATRSGASRRNLGHTVEEISRIHGWLKSRSESPE